MLEEIIRCAKARGIPEESFLDSVQKKYAVYVQAGHLGSLRALQEITGIKPAEGVLEKLVDFIVK